MSVNPPLHGCLHVFLISCKQKASRSRAPCFTYLGLGVDGLVDMELSRLVYCQDLASRQKDDLDNAPDIVPHRLYL